MTDFLATLALRGAGLPPADGRGALAPRPRARFEPDTTGAVGDATLVERAGDVPAAARPATPVVPAESPGPRDEPPVIDPPPRDGARHPETASRTVAAAPVDRQTPPVRDADETPPRATTVRQPGKPQPPARTATSQAVPTTAPRPAPARDAPTGAAAPPTADARPTSDGSSPAVTVVAPQPLATPPRSAIVRLPEAPEARPAVTVSIGRIDVEVAPPRPATPVQRSAPERTRGFEHYARARRGRPRS